MSKRQIKLVYTKGDFLMSFTADVYFYKNRTTTKLYISLLIFVLFLSLLKSIWAHKYEYMCASVCVSFFIIFQKILKISHFSSSSAAANDLTGKWVFNGVVVSKKEQESHNSKMTSISSSASYSKCATIYSVSHKLSIIFFLFFLAASLCAVVLFDFRCLLLLLLSELCSDEFIDFDSIAWNDRNECVRACLCVWSLIHYATQWWLTSFSLFISVEFWSCFLCKCVRLCFF